MTYKPGKRGRPGRGKTVVVRINADVLRQVKENDPILSNVYSDSVIVDMILRFYLRNRRIFYRLMLDELGSNGQT